MANDALTEARFWGQVITDSARTLMCSPENESRIKTWLGARGLDGLHKVVVSPAIPDDRLVVLDESAIAAIETPPITFDFR